MDHDDDEENCSSSAQGILSAPNRKRTEAYEVHKMHYDELGSGFSKKMKGVGVVWQPPVNPLCDERLYRKLVSWHGEWEMCKRNEKGYTLLHI